MVTKNYMKIFLTIGFIFLYLCCLGQDTIFIKYDRNWYDDSTTYTIDTIVENLDENPFLIGTMLIPETENQLKAEGYGFFAKDVKSTPCKESESLNRPKRYFSNKINKIKENDSLWTVDISIIGNCGHNFLCDISIENDSILNLIYFGYGNDYCKCNCWFGLIYEIEIMQFGTTEDIKYVMINSEEKTLRKIKPTRINIHYKR